MDYNMILAELRQATPFELYRLQAAIAQFLDDPERLAVIKQKLAPGMSITYFNEQENRLVPATLLEVRKTRAVIEESETGERWTIPLVTINLDGVSTDVAPASPRQGLDRVSLRIGDAVGFVGRDGKETFGTVVKLNPKRAKVKTATGTWTVPYRMLFPIIEGDVAQQDLIGIQPR